MAEKPFIRVSRRGLNGNLSLAELIVFALFVAIAGLALAGPLLALADRNPGHHLLNLAIHASLCALPFAFFLAVLLSLLTVDAAPPTAPVMRLAAATFDGAAAAALLLTAVLFLILFSASADAPAALGGRPQPPDGAGFLPWF